MKMERNEHIIPPGSVTFEITDDRGHTIIMSPEQAHDLLQWLYDRRQELHQVATRDIEPQPEHKAELPPTWIVDDNHHEPI